MKIRACKTPAILPWCLVFFLIIPSCSNSVQESPVYIKFARGNVWQSWIEKSKQIDFPDSNLPFSSNNPVHEKECLYEDIRGGIVSHHLLIAPVLMAYYKELVKVKPGITTFFIAGPDHFRMSKARITVGTKPYCWGKQSVLINKKAASELIRNLNIQKDTGPFKGEHSVMCHIPFIAWFFPGADVVPVIVDSDCRLSVCRRVSKFIRRYMNNNPGCFFLLSIDFSHNLGARETKERDVRSFKVLAEMSPVFSRYITCDSPRSWYIFTNTFSEVETCMDFAFYTTNQEYLGISAAGITSYFFTFLRIPLE